MAKARQLPKSPKRSTSLTWLHWLTLSFVIVLLDQASKFWVAQNFHLYEVLRITSFFNFVRVHNTGAAFSFLAHAGGWQRWFFTAIGVLACIVILFFLKRHANQKLFSLSLAFILGGAIGNVIDRLSYGYVIDFLDFYFKAWHFPAFNLADSAITLGVIGMLADELLRVKKT